MINKKKINISKKENKVISHLLEEANLIINIEEEGSLDINLLSIDKKTKVEINLFKKAVLNYHHALINNSGSEIDIVINDNYKSQANVLINGINVKDSEMIIKVISSSKERSIDAVNNQKIEVINLGDGKNYICPILEVPSNYIQAEHSSYIGTFREDEIFYLNQRGVKDPYKFLTTAFLLKNIKDKEEFKEIIIKEVKYE